MLKIYFATLVLSILSASASEVDMPFDIYTTHGQIEFFQSVMSRHGNIATDNLHYSRSFKGALDELLEVHAKLPPEQAQPIWVAEVERAVARYSEVPMHYDSAALERLRAVLREDLRICGPHSSSKPIWE